MYAFYKYIFVFIYKYKKKNNNFVMCRSKVEFSMFEAAMETFSVPLAGKDYLLICRVKKLLSNLDKCLCIRTDISNTDGKISLAMFLPRLMVVNIKSTRGPCGKVIFVYEKCNTSFIRLVQHTLPAIEIAHLPPMPQNIRYLQYLLFLSNSIAWILI